MQDFVEFKDISKSYAKETVLEGVNLSVADDDFMAVYGLPSSGKSVLLRLLMGLEAPDRGEIRLRGRVITKVSAKERNLGYVPQDFALYPHKTVYENIAYPLRLMKQPISKIDPAIRRTAEMLTIEDLLKKLPTQLSGGQKQRVAIARGIVKQSDVLVLDDPLSGLDFKLREKLIDDLKILQLEFGSCFIYTTSDPIETLMLASRAAVLHNGRIREIGPPDELYQNPLHLSTMDILGYPRANLAPGVLFKKNNETWCRTDLFEFPVEMNSREHEAPPSGDVTVGIRPESLQRADSDNGNGLKALITLKEDLGAEEIIYLKIKERTLTMIKPAAGEDRLQMDEYIRIGLAGGSLLVFERNSGNRIGRGSEQFHV